MDKPPMKISPNYPINILSRLAIIASFILFTFSSTGHPVVAQTGANEYHSYLPILMDDSYFGFSSDEKFVGLYMMKNDNSEGVYWIDENVKLYMPLADRLAGKKHSVVATFASLKAKDQDGELGRQLEALWQAGYLFFINFPSTWTSYDIAAGTYDSYLRNTAGAYARWANQGDGRIAFIAPLPEMNGAWTSYGGNPANFKLAYRHFITIFAEQGVTRDKVWWVFAPNGGSTPGNEFENYYPGDDVVDVVAFSSYNYGYCHVTYPWGRWQNYDTLYKPFLERIQLMAPWKPVIIAQTGTTAEFQAAGEFNVTEKNNWLKTNYEYLSQQPQFLGILYFDYNQSPTYCNWRILPGTTFTGYTEGVASPAYQYLDATAMHDIIP
jgi:hypothetical protein